MKIFKPTINYSEESLIEVFKKNPKNHYFELIESTCFPKFYSSKELAYAALEKEFLKFDQEDGEFFYMSIEELGVDLEYNYKEFFYDKNLEELGVLDWEDKEFLGVEDNSSKFEVGEWVLYFEGDCLMVGKIGAAPMTVSEKNEYYAHLELDSHDNSYYILCGNYNDKDTHPHSHPAEAQIIKKIDQTYLNQIFPQDLIRDIDQRYKEYVEYQKERQKLRKKKSEEFKKNSK